MRVCVCARVCVCVRVFAHALAWNCFDCFLFCFVFCEKSHIKEDIVIATTIKRVCIGCNQIVIVKSTCM